MQEHYALGAAAALGSAASWAVGAFLFKALGESLTPLAMTLAKGVCSLAILGTAIFVLGPAGMEGRAVALLALSGLLGIALGDTFFFRALRGLSPLSLLVMMVLGQVLTVGAAVAFLNESLSTAAALGIPLVLGGVVLVLWSTSSGEGATTRWDGVFYGLLAVLCMAASTVILKLVVGTDRNPGQPNFIRDSIQELVVRMLAGTAGVLLVGIVTAQVKGWAAPFQQRKLAGRFVLAVAVIAFGGFWLSQVALTLTTVAVASILTATEPVFALVIGAIFYRERTPLMACIGTVITFAGVVILAAPGVADTIRTWLCRMA
jgi:drug/metabolite transporter (DMT)-like permease